MSQLDPHYTVTAEDMACREHEEIHEAVHKEISAETAEETNKKMKNSDARTAG